MSERNKSNEIRITRIYDAPVKAVWEAWTNSAMKTRRSLVIRWLLLGLKPCFTNVELAEEGPERTRVTVTWEPYGAVTPGRGRNVHQIKIRDDSRLEWVL